MDVELEEIDLAEVQHYVSCLEHKWYSIGLQLGLEPCRLDSIRSSCGGRGGGSAGECLVAVIKLWLRGLGHRASWATLCRALEGAVLSSWQVAAQIRREKGGCDISFSLSN